jgi:hypothetical protein
MTTDICSSTAEVLGPKGRQLNTTSKQGKQQDQNATQITHHQERAHHSEVKLRRKERFLPVWYRHLPLNQN